MWQQAVNYIYISMLIGFGLCMGGLIFAGFIKYSAKFIEYLVLKTIGYKTFSYEAKPLDKVRLADKNYIVNSIVQNQNKTHKTFYLTGIGEKNPNIVISITAV